MAGTSSGNDFFLKFDSNAAPFSEKLAGDLDPGIGALKELTAALASYESQAAKSKGGSSPLGAAFQGLDEAVSRMERVTGQFSSRLGQQLDEMTRRVNLLRQAAERIGKGGPAAGGAPLQDPGRLAAAFDRGKAAGIAEAQKKIGASPAASTAANSASTGASKETTAALTQLSAAEEKAVTRTGQLTAALKELNDQLQLVTRSAKAAAAESTPKSSTSSSSNTSSNDDAGVTVENTSANPVPVVLVGDESAGAAVGKGKGKQEPPRKATTATSTARAEESIARAAEETTGSKRGPRPKRTLDFLASVDPDEFDLRRSRGTLTAYTALSDDTQRQLWGAREALKPGVTESAAEREQIVKQAAAAIKADPAYRSLGPASLRVSNLTGMLGLDQGYRSTVQQYLKEGGIADHENQANRGITPPAGSTSSSSANAKAQADAAAARAAINESNASAEVKEAMRNRVVALTNLTELEESGNATQQQLLRAENQYARALQAEADAVKTQQRVDNPSLFGRLSGNPQRTFGQSLQQRLGHDLPNVVGYSLIFTGFEKLREVAHTGLEAQAAFTRLQASLDANGIAAGNLKTQLSDISANTATPIETVIEAASELSGTFKQASEIEFGAHIASQLANISQGTLSAKEAAIGLRDVYAAYGDTWGQSSTDINKHIQATGDQIAHLSQLTGVSVKDITEGTTQIAQEAKDFNLNENQASTLAAYIAQGTGETGEESAAQLSRMLAGLYNGKAQTALVKAGVATDKQFTDGDIGGVLKNLIEKYDKLNPNSKQNIASLLGTGIQARAFAALVNGGPAAAAAMDGEGGEKGTLNRQNQAYLNTIAGETKKLSEDFQNIGVELEKIGAFDAIGLLAKALDAAAIAVRKLLSGLTDVWSSIFGHSQVSQDLMHMVVMIGEGVAAWKLFGSAASSALAKVGILRITPASAAARAEAEAAGTALPRAQYTGGSALAGFGTRAVGLRGVAGDIRRGEGHLTDLTPAGLLARGKVAAAEASKAAAIEAETKSELELAAANEKAVAAQAAKDKATADLMAAESQGAVLEEDLNKLRADQAVATEAFIAASRAAAIAQEALATASGEAAAAAEASAVASQAQTEVREGGFAAGFAGVGGRLLPIAGLGAILAAPKIGSLISGGQSTSGPNAGMRGYWGSVGSSAAVGGGIGAMVGGPVGAVLGTAAGGLFGAGKAVLSAKSYRDSFASDKSTNDEIALMNLVYNNPNSPMAVKNAQKRLGYKAPVKGMGIDQVKNLRTADDVTDFEKTEEAFIDKHAKDIEKAGGNSKKAQESIKRNIDQMKASLKDAAAARLQTLQGLGDLDKMNATQIDTVSDLAQTISQFNSSTMATQGSAIKQMLQSSGLGNKSGEQKLLNQAAGQANDDAGVLGLNSKNQLGEYDAYGNWHSATKAQQASIGPTAGSNLTHVSSPVGTFESRRAAMDKLQDDIIKNTTAQLASGKYGVGTDQYNDLKQRQSAALQAKQQLDSQKYTVPAQIAQAQSSYLENQGSDAGAVRQLQVANAQLSAYNRTLQKDDPQYWTNLQQIQQNKQQIAALQADPRINALTVAAAQTTDATQSASLQYQIAVATLRKDQSGPHTAAQIAQDQASVAQRQIGVTQAGAATSEATAQANIAGIRNDVGKAQAQLNDALRQEALYRGGGSLADQASYENAVAQEAQDRIAIKDAIEAQTQSEYDVTSALQKLHGNDVGAAETAKKKAQQAYKYALDEYGAGSTEANQALTQLDQAQSDLYQAQLDKASSAIDLQIAQLNARGAQGDDVKAAEDETRKAKLALASYTKHGGKKGTTEYNNLQAAIVTAKRNQFDTALQAQLDTLDFQQQTYQITSAQEVQSLQKILKNKQLTLKEQRDITLKIKNMQESIRDQLTQGGLNIPSNITLPTAYDVRRSLGPGFGGTSTTTAGVSSTVNNNQKVQINNNVPTHAVANQIANQVIKLINQQTTKASRANTSTPRLVHTK